MTAKRRYTCVVLCFVLLQLSLAGAATNSAFATGIYDDTVQTVNRLVVRDYDNAHFEDVTSSYVSHFYDKCDKPSVISSFQGAKTTGAYNIGVVRSTTRESVVVFWSTTTGASATFHDQGDGTHVLYADSVSGYFSLDMYYSQNVSVTCNLAASSNGFPISDDYSAIYGESFGSWSKVFSSTYQINYPNGYSGTLVPTTNPPIRYVAMGDSFSSGEGNSPFEYGTNVGGTNENRCHRSFLAYPRLMQNDSALDVSSTSFVACSGATTANVLYGGSGAGAWNEPAQVDALTGYTQHVTLTIGGNDVGFSDYAKTCVTFVCGPGSPIYDAIMLNINATPFAENLKTTYRKVLDEASAAKVYILDYPYLFDPSGEDDSGCTIADGSGGVQVQQALNSTISLAIAQVRSESTDYSNRLMYVNTNQSGSPFEGRHLCTDDARGAVFYPVYLPPLDTSRSLHPNASGQQAYYQLVKEAIG